MDEDVLRRRKYLNSILALAMGVALVLACSSETKRTVTVGGLRFEVPGGWKTTVNSSTRATVSSADGGLQVVCSVLDENSSEFAVKDLDQEISKTIKKVETVGKPTQDTRDGIPHYAKSGTGEVDGTTITWSVDVFSAGKLVIFLAYAPPNVYQKNSADYEKLINSINKD